jgi:hypothetical protein
MTDPTALHHATGNSSPTSYFALFLVHCRSAALGSAVIVVVDILAASQVHRHS